MNSGDAQTFTSLENKLGNSGGINDLGWKQIPRYSPEGEATDLMTCTEFGPGCPSRETLGGGSRRLK